MQGPFLVAIVFTLIIGVIGQHKEFFTSLIAVIFFGIFLLVSIVLLTKGFKEFKEYRRGKKQERASIRQWNSSTPQSPRAAKDAAAYNQAIAQQQHEKRKGEFASWYPHELSYIMQEINNTIAQGRIVNNIVMVTVKEMPKNINESIYYYYIDEIKRDLEKAYISHGWKSVDIKMNPHTDYDNRIKLEIRLYCD